VDLDDMHGNTADGVHIASSGGTWLALVAGFAGLRDRDGELRFRPRLPAQWERLRFPLCVQGRALEIVMTRDRTTYELRDGEPLTIVHEDRELHLEPGQLTAAPCSASS
jgi:alpha,alpha-trehalose phosphorylase